MICLYSVYTEDFFALDFYGNWIFIFLKYREKKLNKDIKKVIRFDNKGRYLLIFFCYARQFHAF